MSSNIGDLIDRVYREYLEPMDDLQPYTLLTNSGGINASDTTIKFDASLLTQEEEDVMESGSIIEIGTELILCKTLDSVDNEVTVVRGVRGTTATTHAEGAEIKISPVFPRKNVFDAVCDQIKNLYPTLFATETKTVTAAIGYEILGDHGTDQDNNNYLVAPLRAISQYTDFSANSDETGIQYRGVSVSLVDLPNPFTHKDRDWETALSGATK